MGTATAFDLAGRRERERISFTLFLAVVAHIFIFWFVELDIERAPVRNQVEVSVSLIEQEVENADFLSSNSQRGGGSLDEARLLSIDSPPQIFANEPAPTSAQILAGAASTATGDDWQDKSGNRRAALLLTRIEAATAMTLEQSESSFAAQFEQQMQNLQSVISDIEARLTRERQTLSRRDDVKRLTSVSSLAAAEAEYIEYWLETVEAIANMNYPQEASRRGVEGSLRLAVRVSANGQILAIKTLASSGHKILDDAAHNIVRLAEPFAPFPAAMSADNSAIEIIRTWKFYRQSAALSD